MRNYLEAIICEQIERGSCLKALIPHPMKYPELTGLAERCGRIIDENIEFLQSLNQQLGSRTESDIRDILRELRICYRNIAFVEAYGIPVLYYSQTTEMKYLNKLIFKIYQEIHYPLDHPAVACLSTKYYYFFPFTNVIFVPISETSFLLHLSDIYHELGHGVLFNKDNHPKLTELNEKYNEIIENITLHYEQAIIRTSRDAGPNNIPRLLKLIQYQWKTYWVDEFLSDLFALYTLGPAYAYSHLHITTKISRNIYEFSPMFPKSHPSDDARMRMLCIALKRTGFHDRANDVISKWNSMPFVQTDQPSVDYPHVYPEILLENMVNLFLDGLLKCEFPIIVPQMLNELGENDIRKLLNNAWDKFWVNPNEFRRWEEKTIEKIKAEYQKD